jgi:hypothetical protein
VTNGEGVGLEAQLVLAKMNARYGALVQQLISENAHLEAYVAMLERQLEQAKEQAKSAAPAD